MKVSSQQLTIRQLLQGRSPLANLRDAVDLAFGPDVTPLGVSVTGRSRAGLRRPSACRAGTGRFSTIWWTTRPTSSCQQ
jgi:hypothetical protein